MTGGRAAVSPAIGTRIIDDENVESFYCPDLGAVVTATAAPARRGGLEA